jgi:hypothetical protein
VGETAPAGGQDTALVGIACFWVVAAAIAVTPLVGGLLLAGRWRRYEWAIGFGVVLMFAVLGSGLLVQLADG